MGLPDGHRSVAAGLAALAVLGPARAHEPALTLATGEPTAEQRRALAHGQAPPAEASRPVDREEARREGRPSAGGGLSGSVGRAFTEHAPDGWFGRLELEGFGAGRFEGAGSVGGVTLGVELWVAGDSGGGGLPVSFWLGYRTPTLVGGLGLGALMIVVDEVEGDGGFGVWAPLATAALGIEVGGTRLLADGRTLYRWQWGAPDRAQVQLGLRLVHFLESPAQPRPGRH